MPAPTIPELAKNPDFWDYSSSQQTAIFDRVDPRFKSLSPESKKEFLSKLTANTKISPLPETEPSQPIRTGLTVAGGIAGGIAGTMTAGPGAGVLGKIVGAATGTAIGASGAEAWYQVSQHLMDDPNVPQTSKEAATEIMKAGLTEAAWDVGGQIPARIVGKALAPFAKKVMPEAQKVINWLDSKIKPALLPAEATESRVLDVLQNVGEASIFGGGAIKKYKFNRDKVFDDLADDVIDMFGKKIEPDEAGELFVDAIEDRNKTFKAVANTMYNKVSEMTEFERVRVPVTKQVESSILGAGGKPLTKETTEYVMKREGGAWVSTKNLKQFAKPLAEEAKELVGIEAANAGDDLVKAVIGLPDQVPFSVAQKLRSRLISKADEFSIVNKKAPVIGLSKKMTEIIDGDISKSLKAYDQDAYELWRNANKFYKHESKKFNSALIRRLVKKGEDDPEGIAKAIFKPNNITTIRKVKATLTPNEWTSMQSYYMQLLLKQGSTNDIVVGQKMINRMVGKPTSMGTASLKEIFNPEQLKEIFNFADTLKLAQKRQSEGTGKMFIQLAQASAVVGVGTGIITGDWKSGAAVGGAAVVFGPVMVSHMLVRPKIARYLTQGIKIHANSPEAIGIITRLIRGSMNIKKQIAEQESTNE